MILIGDSLAVGIAAASHVPAKAMVGRTSKQAAPLIARAPDDVLWVSLGANDPDAPGPFRVLVRRALRGRTCVAWLEPPRKPRLQSELRQASHRDHRLHVVSLKGVRRADGIHPGPAGYRLLAKRMRRAC